MKLHLNLRPHLQFFNEVKKVDHYYLSINAVTQPMQVREEAPPYGDKKE